MKNPKTVIIDYTNWRGQRGLRKIIPGGLCFRATEWHPEPQWLVTALDLGKDEIREFAMKDIHSWSPVK